MANESVEEAEQAFLDQLNVALERRRDEVTDAIRGLAQCKLPDAVGVIWLHVSSSTRNLPVSVFALDHDAVDEVLDDDSGGKTQGALVGPALCVTQDSPLVSDAEIETLHANSEADAYELIARRVTAFLGECAPQQDLRNLAMRFYAAHLNAAEVLDLKAGEFVSRAQVQGRDDTPTSHE